MSATTVICRTCGAISQGEWDSEGNFREYTLGEKVTQLEIKLCNVEGNCRAILAELSMLCDSGEYFDKSLELQSMIRKIIAKYAFSEI